MGKNTTRIGLFATAGAGAAALAIAGFALPANAADTANSWDETTTATSASSSVDGFRTMVHDLLQGNDTAAGNLGVDGGLVNAPLVEGPLVADVANGPIASGNDTPVASGNETLNGNDTLSGNDVSAPVASGNDVSAPVDAPVGSGNDTVVDAPVGSGNDTSSDTSTDVGTEVRDLVDGVTGDLGVDLGGLGR